VEGREAPEIIRELLEEIAFQSAPVPKVLTAKP
jgi:hypothetical protein